MELSRIESDDLDRKYLRQLRQEFPQLKLVDKADDTLSRVIAGLLRVVTFGAQRAYLESVVTTLGSGLYFPRDWETRTPEQRYITLRHEVVHLRQFRRFGRAGMGLIYLLGGLPLGLAWGRARLEWPAYVETLRATAEVYGLESLDDPALKRRLIGCFVGPAYGWMWPFPRTIARWYDRVCIQLRDDDKDAWR